MKSITKDAPLKTAVFRIGRNGNGTVYYRRTPAQIDALVREYRTAGWTVTPLPPSGAQEWYQLD